MKNKLVFLGSFLCGLLFIVSAWFKLYPIEPFEYKIVGTTFISWVPSVFVARLVIGVEFAIGLLLITTYRLKDSLKLAIALLSLFSIHLLAVLILQGNISDCGCMGTLLSMTPIQGLIKNLVLIGLALLLHRHAYHFELKVKGLINYVLFISCCIVFMLNPVDLSYSEKYLNKPFEGFELNLDTLYRIEKSEKVEKPVLDIRKEKLVLAFVSASCPHCKIAAQKISVIKRENPKLPFYFFVNGDDADIKKFLAMTECSDIPHSRLNGPLFVEMAGLQLPVIYYYNAGKIEKQVDYYTLEQYHIEQWLNNSGRLQ